jgi:hypothetical protein
VKMIKLKKQYPGRLSRLSFFTRLEMAELPKLLMPNERVLGVISGIGKNGTALLAVTSSRLLIIDKKWVRLAYEDIRYESINEIRYAQQALLASAKLYIMGREISFKSWYKKELRQMVQYIQDKMFETRPAGVSEDQAVEGYQRKIVSRSQMHTSSQMDDYLNDRIRRWRKASRFVEDLRKV